MSRKDSKSVDADELDERPVVAVDLDGVLARYKGWRGLDHIGEPIPGAQAFVRKLRERFKVIIYTTRTNRVLHPEASPLRLRARIRAWLTLHGFEVDGIFSGEGKPLAVAYIDDRAVPCRPMIDLGRRHYPGDKRGAYSRALRRLDALTHEWGGAQAEAAAREVQR